ncbi:bifunctional folylpolyglutamate synthase/dihydrofolate synthase [Domibacillus aminovorans]|uniref:Dihydrofolate synthase/folylpolyglutamate synthase n=1 Tax=Domibacillus aminovorans TaxID=29332 RepID=A0A177KS43_9BACI|nr:folylpolyglutamate synthase/dihydrofolate synthase family protein [Domibacillus aminovorans]OAH56149.1 bifunctional folylpolyglutamate synthase/dihydrofolate synthase [Domibacillus aminovorans]
MNTYEEALSWIHGRLRTGIKPGLSRMEWIMERLGHPERRLKAVHIGGTNGKGSTTAMLRSILSEAGYEVGTFTSPYIEQFNERISINGTPISDHEITLLAQKIRILADEMEDMSFGGPSEFEIITAMAFYYFAYVRPVDIVLFEVGLGGRLDSTNIVHPILSIITTIGMDHIQFLGDTLAEIAFEKAGIIKNGVPVITAVEQPEALDVIERVAKEKKAAVYLNGREFSGTWLSSTEHGEQFGFQSSFSIHGQLETGLAGLHQVNNAALAIMAADYLRAFYSFFIEDEHVEKGLENIHWPGRFETLYEKPLIIADGAHNEEGINALVKTIHQRFSDRNITILFAAMKDKPLDKMIQQLKGVADQLYFAPFDFPRAAKKEDYEPFVTEYASLMASYETMIQLFKNDAQQDEVLIITGSLYFISSVKNDIKSILSK